MDVQKKSGHRLCVSDSKSHSEHDHLDRRHSLFAVARDVLGDAVAAVQDHDQGLAVVGFLKGRDSTHQHVQDHPQGPDIWNTHTRRDTHTHTDKRDESALNRKIISLSLKIAFSVLISHFELGVTRWFISKSNTSASRIVKTVLCENVE